MLETLSTSLLLLFKQSSKSNGKRNPTLRPRSYIVLCLDLRFTRCPFSSAWRTPLPLVTVPIRGGEFFHARVSGNVCVLTSHTIHLCLSFFFFLSAPWSRSFVSVWSRFPSRLHMPHLPPAPRRLLLRAPSLTLVWRDSMMTLLGIVFLMDLALDGHGESWNLLA